MPRHPTIPRLPHDFFDGAAPFKIDGVYCKLIPLTWGIFAIVDAEDYPALSVCCWCAMWEPTQKTYYASRTFSRNGEVISISMHRQIMGLKKGDPEKVDHENRCTFDNRRKNLREATTAQNVYNSCKHRDNTSGYKNVTLHRPSGRYFGRLMVRGKRLHICTCDDPRIAFELVREAAKLHHGEFARTD